MIKESNKFRPLGAIVLAAGLGTRMRSRRAKVLHELGGRALITYPLIALQKAGAHPIVVIVGHQEAEVRAACDSPGVLHLDVGRGALWSHDTACSHRDSIHGRAHSLRVHNTFDSCTRRVIFV